MAPTPDLILHHYDFSNYAEKARLALGYKGLAWRSVIIPPVAPKPDLTPLTGGYRRTPVLQIGADIYCDTRLILRELERRHPEPPIFPAGFEAEAAMIAYWAENQLFRPMSLYVSGHNLDLLPPDLQADRSRMRGLPEPSVAAVRQAARRSAPPVRVQLGWIEALLADGRPWIVGPAVTIADFAVYHALWFVTARSDRLAPALAPHQRIAAWMERMRAFGHGARTPMAPADALAIARATEPAPVRASAPFAEDPPLGTPVRIRADDYARDGIVGDLVFIDETEIALRRVDAAVGEVVVHFPRLGYDLRPGRSP
ncbi:MAG: glutathione S-transferase family protein [Alphaproteobacteria bacterium]|nr:glutathione S-transferase family protein [Alphaproteobacteria bacterium]MCB9929089.1 glutathione S-transferase family protein [Alphaproteobacteria bacterium]